MNLPCVRCGQPHYLNGDEPGMTAEKFAEKVYDLYVRTAACAELKERMRQWGPEVPE